MRLILCGQTRLLKDRNFDTEIPIASKSLALLVYITFEPGTHSREKLCGLLWGEVSDEKAHGSLRQALRQLRAAVGNILGISRTSVELAAPLETDVSEFLNLASADPDRAVEVEIPRVFESLQIPNAPVFEEWIEHTRQKLLRQFRLTLSVAVNSAHARHDWKRALELATRWQSLDPFSDEAEHALIEILFIMGARDAALASYRRYRDERERVTRHPPGLALRELAERIEHTLPHAAPSRARTAGTHPTAITTTLPSFEAALIGRDAAWSALEKAWAACSNGRSHVVIVEGEAGIGKSRLLTDFLHLVAARHASVFRGRAYQSSSHVPYGAMLDVLRAAVNAPGAAGTDGVWLAEVSRIIPEVRQVYPSVPEPGTHPLNGGSLLHEAIAQLLLATADENPIVVAMDDLEWCDADSCALLHFLIRRLDAAPILWCVTLTLGAFERDAPAARLARALRGVPVHTRVQLEPLSCEEIRRLICDLGRVHDPQGARRLSARMHEVTGGNPLYVVELLKTLFERHWLTVKAESGEWLTTESGTDELHGNELFPTVHDAIAERILGLPDEQHALLLTIAVAGGGCHASLLSFVHGISRLRAAHICDVLVNRHLVVDEAGTYRCAHNVITSVVLETMSASRRREVHRMIALALTSAAESIRQTADPGVVARHAELGGEEAMAHRFALEASRESVERLAWDEAMRWLDMASTNAYSAEEVQAADRATAELFDRAGWSVAPLDRKSSLPGSARLTRSDVDIGNTASEAH